VLLVAVSSKRWTGADDRHLKRADSCVGACFRAVHRARLRKAASEVHRWLPRSSVTMVLFHRLAQM